MEQRSSRDSSTRDVELIGRMAGGDPTALRQFYDLHSPIAYAICLRILRDSHDAEEVLIDVFHEFWRRSATFDSSRGSPVGLLVTLARSRAIDRRRSNVKSRAVNVDEINASEMPSRSPQPAPAAELDQREQQSSLRAAMKCLQPQQREVIEAAYYDGMSHSEIAAAMNKPLGTVKTNIRQGIVQLRNLLRPGPTEGGAR